MRAHTFIAMLLFMVLLTGSILSFIAKEYALCVLLFAISLIFFSFFLKLRSRR